MTTAYRVAGEPGLRVHVVEAALACCALEVAAARAAGLLVPDQSPDAVTADAPDAATGAEPAVEPLHVLVVSGTVTTALAPAVQRAVAALPEPRAVVAFGACAGTGGPYWDSYAVLPGVDSLVPVAVYVPGCPPRPHALVDGLRALRAPVAGTPR